MMIGIQDGNGWAGGVMTLTEFHGSQQQASKMTRADSLWKLQQQLYNKKTKVGHTSRSSRLSWSDVPNVRLDIKCNGPLLEK